MDTLSKEQLKLYESSLKLMIDAGLTYENIISLTKDYQLKAEEDSKRLAICNEFNILLKKYAELLGSEFKTSSDFPVVLNKYLEDLVMNRNSTDVDDWKIKYFY